MDSSRLEGDPRTDLSVLGMTDADLSVLGMTDADLSVLGMTDADLSALASYRTYLLEALSSEE